MWCCCVLLHVVIFSKTMNNQTDSELDFVNTDAYPTYEEDEATKFR